MLIDVGFGAVHGEFDFGFGAFAIGAIAPQVLIDGGYADDAIDALRGDVGFKGGCGEALGGVEFGALVVDDGAAPVFGVLLELGEGFAEEGLCVLDVAMFEEELGFGGGGDGPALGGDIDEEEGVGFGLELGLGGLVGEEDAGFGGGFDGGLGGVVGEASEVFEFGLKVGDFLDEEGLMEVGDRINDALLLLAVVFEEEVNIGELAGYFIESVVDILKALINALLKFVDVLLELGDGFLNLVEFVAHVGKACNADSKAEDAGPGGNLGNAEDLGSGLLEAEDFKINAS